MLLADDAEQPHVAELVCVQGRQTSVCKKNLLLEKTFVDSKGFTALLASEAAKRISHHSISVPRGPADAERYIASIIARSPPLSSARTYRGAASNSLRLILFAYTASLIS